MTLCYSCTSRVALYHIRAFFTYTSSLLCVRRRQFFYPDVNVLVLLTILYPQLNFYSVMPTIKRKTILFLHRVLVNSHYVLQLVLPQQHETQYYNLRSRQHDRLLIPKTADLNDRDFIVRMLYKSCY